MRPKVGAIVAGIAKESSLTASGQALKLSDGRTLKMDSPWTRPSSR